MISFLVIWLLTNTNGNLAGSMVGGVCLWLYAVGCLAICHSQTLLTFSQNDAIFIITYSLVTLLSLKCKSNHNRSHCFFFFLLIFPNYLSPINYHILIHIIILKHLLLINFTDSKNQPQPNYPKKDSVTVQR